MNAPERMIARLQPFADFSEQPGDEQDEVGHVHGHEVCTGRVRLARVDAQRSVGGDVEVAARGSPGAEHEGKVEHGAAHDVSEA
jgi:hypothetical protein